MRKQDHLLGLINSLNANEKRHFRLFAAQQQENTNYLKLFDALEGKEQYNASQLSSTLRISAAQLNNQKNYLAKVLLKSLRYYTDGSTPDAYLANTIQEIEDLIARRLFDYATELLDKALVYAEENDYPRAITYLVKQKLSIALLTGNFEEVLQLDTKMQKALTEIREEHEVQNMTALVAQFERRRRIEEEFPYHNHALLHIKPEDLKSKRAMLAWFPMISGYLLGSNQLPDVIVKHARKAAAFFEADSNLQKNAPLQYIRCYAELVAFEANADNYDKAWEDSEKLLAIIAQHKALIKPGEANHFLEFAETVRGQVTFYQGKYDTSLNLSKHLYARKQRLNTYMQIQAVFNLARALIHNGHAAGAISALDELLELGPGLRADLQPYIRPMIIMAQLQQGNYQLVPYLVRTTRAWMKRQKLTDVAVDAFLSHVYSIARAPISKRKTEWLTMKAPIANKDYDYFQKNLHVNRWIDEYMM